MTDHRPDALIESLRDPEYRRIFFADLVNGSVAAQIKANRERRGWNQQELADRAGMNQSRISLMESINYESWSVNTLRRLASALDLVLSVRFQSFSQALEDFSSFSSDALFQPPFDEDHGFDSKKTGDNIVEVEIAGRRLVKIDNPVVTEVQQASG